MESIAAYEWTLVICADIALAVYTFLFFRSRISSPVPARFHFRITDIWAATLALSPTLMLFAALLNGSARESDLAPRIAMLFIPHQLAGMLFFILRRGTTEVTLRDNAIRSSVFIIIGSFVGLFLPILSFLFIFIMAFAIPLLLVPPFWLLISWFGTYFRVKWRKT